METDWEKELYAIAKEIHQLQLEEVETLESEETIKTDWKTIRLTAKINYLIGYIISIDYLKEKEEQ